MDPALGRELVFEQAVDHAVPGELGFGFEGVGGDVDAASWIRPIQVGSGGRGSGC